MERRKCAENGVSHTDGEEVFFEGSYTIHTAKGDVTFFHQGGRLVAILFADDLALIAENVKDAQVLLDATNEFYTAAGATLCAPKSLYTASDGVDAWSVQLSGFDAVYTEAIVQECRRWLKERRTASNTPSRSHGDVGTKDGAVILINDPLILEHSGDPVHWLEAVNVFVPDPSVTLAGALRRAFPDLAIQLKVHNCPLHVVNAQTQSGGLAAGST